MIDHLAKIIIGRRSTDETIEEDAEQDNFWTNGTASVVRVGDKDETWLVLWEKEVGTAGEIVSDLNLQEIIQEYGKAEKIYGDKTEMALVFGWN